MSITVMVLGIVGVVGVVALFCTAGLAGYWWGRAHLYDQAVRKYGELWNTSLDFTAKMLTPLMENLGIFSEK